MLVNTNNVVAMIEANQNFLKAIRLVDEDGMAVILKNNRPRYVVVNFDEYDEIQAAQLACAQKLAETADTLIDENLEALKKLAKTGGSDRFWNRGLLESAIYTANNALDEVEQYPSADCVWSVLRFNMKSNIVRVVINILSN